MVFGIMDTSVIIIEDEWIDNLKALGCGEKLESMAF